MQRQIHVLIVVYLFFVVTLIIDSGDANGARIVHRYKRYLTFSNISHFFVRLNFKANMVPWNQIFAQAIGYRMNWDDPPDSFHPHHHLNRRDLYNNLEILLNRNGLNGFHCVRRAICEVNSISEAKGIYLKILKMVFRKTQTSTTKRWHEHTDVDCQLSINSCPFSAIEISPYTDL